MNPLVFLAPVAGVLLLVLIVVALRARPPKVRIDHGIHEHRKHMAALSSEGSRQPVESTGITLLGPAREAEGGATYATPDEVEA